MSIKMPGLLNYWSVDELAECLDGVGEELYKKLYQVYSPKEMARQELRSGMI
jgi:hypothetical protein